MHEYLGLEGGPPTFRQDFTCPALLKDNEIYTHTGLSPATARLSRRFCFHTHCHWPGPRSLATTSGVSVDVLSCGYLDVSVPRVRFLTLWIQVKIPFIDTWKPFRLFSKTTSTVLFRSRPYRPSKMAWPARARRISGDGRSALRSSARFELFSLANLTWEKNTVQSTASATARRPLLAALAEDSPACIRRILAGRSSVSANKSFQPE